MEVYTDETPPEAGSWHEKRDNIDYYVTLQSDRNRKCGQCFFHNDNRDLCMKHDCYGCTADDQACVDIKDRSWGCVICGQVIRCNQKSEDYPQCESGKGFQVHTKCKDILGRQKQRRSSKECQEMEKRNAEIQKKLGELSGEFKT
jgi:hypothetical protein